MKVKEEIKTTGQLRETLASVIKDLVNGDIGIDEANSIHKVAKNISDSLYSETKIRMFEKELGVKVCKMGELPLGA